MTSGLKLRTAPGAVARRGLAATLGLRWLLPSDEVFPEKVFWGSLRLGAALVAEWELVVVWAFDVGRLSTCPAKKIRPVSAQAIRIRRRKGLWSTVVTYNTDWDIPRQ